MHKFVCVYTRVPSDELQIGLKKNTSTQDVIKTKNIKVLMASQRVIVCLCQKPRLLDTKDELRQMRFSRCFHKMWYQKDFGCLYWCG